MDQIKKWNNKTELADILFYFRRYGMLVCNIGCVELGYG